MQIFKRTRYVVAKLFACAGTNFTAPFRNEAPGRQFESFFGIPNAPSGSGAILSDSERADEFSDDEPPQFQSTFHSPNFLRVRRSEL